MSSAAKGTIINNMTEGSVASKLFRFAFPLMLANLLQVVYNMVDMIVVGQFVGNVGLSGVAIGGDVLNFITMTCMGFTSASQVMVSQYVGMNDKKSISQTIGTSFTFNTILAVALTVICIACVNPVLDWMNTPPEALASARSYAITCLAGLVFIFGYNMVCSILRGMGDSKRPLLFIAVAAVTNLVLDLLFVAVFNMGVFGTALATVMGQALSFIAALVYLYRHREGFGFDFRPESFRIDRDKLRKMLKLGLPLTLQHAAISASMLIVNSLVNSYGLVYSTVGAVGNKLRTVMMIFSNAITTAASTMVGQNLGAGKPERIKRIVGITFVVTLCAAVLIATVYNIFPTEMFSIFGAEQDVLQYAPLFMRIMAVMLLSFAFMGPFNAVINGIGHATLSFITGMLDGVVLRIGLAVLLGNVFSMGPAGYWLGSALAGFSTAIIAISYYFSGRWKTRKLLVNS